MKKYAIIVAGGKGTRMGADIPKQFLILKNKPILCYSIKAFYNADNSTNIIVVLPQEQIEFWEELCVKYKFNIKHTVIAGGKERFYSVKNGLELTSKNSLIAIHDGVRPLVSQSQINLAFELALKYKGVIPVIDSIDSLRKVENNSSVIINRQAIKRVQTPQVFLGDIILNAYNCSYNSNFTDDASVYENLGEKVFCFLGDEKNIKITTQVDLQFAELLLQA